MVRNDVLLAERGGYLQSRLRLGAKLEDRETTPVSLLKAAIRRSWRMSETRECHLCLYLATETLMTAPPGMYRETQRAPETRFASLHQDALSLPPRMRQRMHDASLTSRMVPIHASHSLSGERQSQMTMSA